MKPDDREKAAVFSGLAEMERIWRGLEHWASQSLRTHKKEPICYMVTSAESGEGKTTLTASLAQALARRSEKRILAMDMNWHNPGFQNYFDIQKRWALKDYKSASINPIQPAGIANLDVLPAPVIDENEPYSTAELSETAINLLNTYRNRYDCVLIDTASLLPVNRNMVDPAVIGHAADAAILVVLTHVTSRQHARRAQKMLESAGSQVAGVVINHREEGQR